MRTGATLKSKIFRTTVTIAMLIAACAYLIERTPVLAAAKSWNGSVSSDWNNGSNWTPAGVPASADDVTLPGGVLPNEPSITAADVTIHNLTVSAGRTLTIGTGRILTIDGSTVAAAVSNSGTVTAGGTGLLRTQGTVTITEAATFTAALQVNTGTTTVTNGSIFDAGSSITIVAGATLQTTVAGGGVTTLGNLTNNGTLSNAGNATFGFSGAGTSCVNNGAITSNFIFSTGAQNLSGSAGTWTGATLFINNSANVTLTSDVTIGSPNFTVGSTGAGTLNLGGFTLTLSNAAFTNTASGSVTGAGTFRTQGTTSMTVNQGTFDASLIVNTGTTTVSNLTIFPAGSSITIDAAATLRATVGGGNVTTLGNLTNNGTLSAAGNATFNFNGMGTSCVNNGAITSNFTFSTGAQNLSGSAGTWTGATLFINNSANVTLTSDVTIGSPNFTVGSTGAGTLNLGGFTLTLSDAAFTNTTSGSVTGAGTFRTQGTTSMTVNQGTFDASLIVNTGTTTVSNGTIFPVGSSITIDAAATLQATVAGGGVTTLGNLTNNGTLSGAGGATFNFNGAGTNCVNNGAITSNFTFSTGAQTLSGSAGTWTGTTLNINNSANVTLTSDVTIGAVTFTVGATGAGTLDITGRTLSLTRSGTPMTVTASGTLVTTGSTIVYNGTAAQTVQTNLNGASYNNLTINNVAGVNLPAATSVPGTLTLTNGLFTIGANLTMGNGALIRRSDGSLSGTPTFGASVDVEYFGPNPITTGNELPSSTTVLHHVTMNNTNTVTLNNARTINGTLFLNSGTFSNGANLTMASGTTIQRDNGTLSSAPTFGASVNVNYVGTTGVTTGPEIPSSASVLSTLLINNPGGVSLGAGGATVNGSFFLVNGNFAVGSNTLVLNNGSSVTSGTLTSGVAGTVNYNQQSNGQAVLAFNYGNLTFSNFNKVLPSGTIGIAGTFTPGSAAGHTITGNTIDFFGAGSQIIPAFNYNNLTSSNGGARTMVSGGTIGIAGTFTPGSNSYTITGNTIDFNGAGAQTIPAFNYFNLSSTSGGARTLASSGIIGIANTFLNGAHSYTLTGSTVEYNGSGVAQSLPAGFTTYNNLNLNNTAGTGGFAGLTVNGLLEVKAGTFTSSSTYNNVQIDNGATLAATAAGTINVSANWTNNGSFTSSTGTVNFNGGAAQSIGGSTLTTFNNLQISNTLGGVSLGSSQQVDGTLTLTNGALLIGANTLTLNGAISSTSGTLTGGASSNIVFDGSGASTSLPAVQNGLNNLTINRANGIALAADLTVNGLLTLTLGDLATGASTLTMPNTATSSGATDVVGNVKRTGFTTGNTLSFGNPFTSISFQSGALPTDITVNLTKAIPASFPTAVARTYSITPNGGGVFSATLRLHYLDTERGANAEGATLSLWRFTGSSWVKKPATAFDISANWSENNTVTEFSTWTLNSTLPTAAPSIISGRIIDSNGAPVEGAVVLLTGTQNRKFITDANGNYRFGNVETNGFYTVTPSRVNYAFSPSSRSFSQLGETTEAAFAATATGQNANPLDTPEYFVRQHYLDFLGREPDEAGFNFWSNQIIECANDNQCVERRRENVSAAYFLSIEFQETGGLVDGLYRAAYGHQSQFSEFMPDTRAVGQGVAVGKEGWQGLLETNKVAFVNTFVNRPAFHTTFDGMDNSLFVDTLVSNTGVTFTPAERDALVSALTTGAQTRADVLRSIAENHRFIAAKFNEAFVMMEYFGYLRRDPDEGGYAFWLNKLHEFNGNFERADMVKAFLVSGEYRDRFPQ